MPCSELFFIFVDECDLHDDTWRIQLSIHEGANTYGANTCVKSFVSRLGREDDAFEVLLGSADVKDAPVEGSENVASAKIRMKD
jgi:hypothetical protein